MTEPSKTLLDQLGGEKRIHYSLDNLKRALSKLGNPEKNVKSVVIAGTNGKGTTTLLVSHALKLQGYKVATYLSPHLQSITERFLINLTPWSESHFNQLCQTYFPLAQQYQLSYFEFLTLLFFVHSSEAKFDINVIEVGMGGRLDATNVTQPHLTAITNIGWDHSEYLGDSLGEILKEKMGILRNTVPVVSGLRQKDLREQLKSDCERLNSPVFFSDSIPRESRSWNWSSQEVLIDGNPFSLNNPTWGTLENATLAYLLLKTGFPEVDLSVIQKAFSATVFPGRFERIQKEPQIILSGDHNEDGVRVLVEMLKKLDSKNNFVLCGFSPDKKADKMIEMLKPHAKEILLTEVPRARGVYAENYGTLAPFEKDPHKALSLMESKLNKDDTLIITGSLYLVGELRKKWFPKVNFILSA